jgi:Phage gp6-like head-tail connector protein
MAGLQVVLPAPALPVSLRALKSHLRVDIKDDDELIEIYARAATENVEGFTRRALVNTGFVQSLDSFPYYTDSMMSQMAYPPAYYSLPRWSTTLWNYSQMIKLFISPLVEVERIDYVDSETGNVLSLYPVAENWLAETQYEAGDEIEDPNGNLQQVTAVAEGQKGISGADEPSWSENADVTTSDGDLTWTYLGAAPEGDFFVDRVSEPPRLFPAPAGGFWPSVLYVPNAVKIYYTCGYGADARNVPACAKVSVLQQVGNWYENRESVTPDNLKEIPNHHKELLWNIRVLDFSPTRG